MSAPTIPAPTASVAPARRARVGKRRTSEAARKQRRRNSLLALLAWVIGLIFVAPIVWMVLTSLHSEANAATNPPSLFAPLTLQSYANFFGSASGASPWPPLINSAIISVLATLVVLVLSIPAAYSLSIRPVRKWSDAMFFFLTTKMLPMVAGLLPIYLIAKALGMLDTLGLMIILYSAMNLPIAIWMMRSFLAEIPVELVEAASVDGASLLLTFRRIILPLASPGIVATSLICFIFSWNELLFANVLTSTSSYTAPVFLTSFVTSEGLFLSKVCAASIVISLPVLIAGFAAQDKLVQGLSLGAVK
ncbi:carbohydrate ABC transporter permease [Humibacter albus]|jgi:sorbitol/mannitol transport system permease protein|uniref:carbohydrate ABC transporter permease n=1 Tax=Humibacter albus TaxID=427754 RepID=UPI0003B40DEC|nr:carbohydrate ABC transporter permease [Humibacter albus]